MTAAVLALGTLAALPAAAAPPPLNLSTVYFNAFDGNGNPLTTLDSRVVSNEQTCHFMEPELRTDLTTASSSKVMVQYWSDSDSAEVHVFVRDPAEQATAVRSEAVLEMFTDPLGLNWDFDQTPSQSDDVTVPFDVAIPYTSEDAWVPFPGMPAPPAQKVLKESFFAGSAPHALVGPASISDGSVKSFRVYDHGRCAAGASLGDIYGELQDGAWCKLKVLARDEGIDVLRRYTHVITQLDREDHGGITDVEDGFLMNASFKVIVTDPGSDVEVRAMMESTFSLNHGHLTVSEKNTDQVTTTCTGWSALCPDHEVHDAITSAIDEMRAAIEKRADSSQSIPIAACTVSPNNPCAVARKTLGQLIEDGAMTLDSQGLGTFSNEEITAMKEAIAPQELWTCDKSEDIQERILHPDACNPVTAEELAKLAAPPMCNFFVPASRLNTYPDEVELVWFDGRDVNNPAYALWVALQSPFAPAGADQDLCASQQTDLSEVDAYTREYASDQRNVAQASTDF